MDFLSELMSSVKMDGPITNGPPPRWQRNKARENTNSSLSLNLSQSLNSSQLTSPNRKTNLTKTPDAKCSKTPKSRTPGTNGFLDISSSEVNILLCPRKTPSKTPKNSPKKPSVTPVWGDRFIPNRKSTNWELSNYLLTQSKEDVPNTEKEIILSQALHGGDIQDHRVLAFSQKPPAAPPGHVNTLRTIYTNSRTPGLKKAATRIIPTSPEKVLDAPDIMDDYYLNLLDWGKNNILAVALRNAVYLWNESTGSIEHLMEISGSDDYISSVNWIQQGPILAIGDSQGAVQLWDTTSLQQVRTMKSHSGRVSSLSWNSYICSSGSRTGAIHHHDVRSGNFLVGESNSHSQEVCGLKWCPDGLYLASGSNDNLLNIWNRAPSDMHSESTPLFSFSDHQAAVKALAWCPWQHNILASGGGTADRHIRFWNVRLGTSIQSVDTQSQVCSIVWSPHYKELVSGHGFANHELIVWKYPTLEKVAELVGHTQRVLNLSLSPDGTTVLSAGADETIRLWKIFQIDNIKKQTVAKPNTKSVLSKCIR